VFGVSAAHRIEDPRDQGVQLVVTVTDTVGHGVVDHPDQYRHAGAGFGPPVRALPANPDLPMRACDKNPRLPRHRMMA
jgi:hypothetical protein